MSTLKKAGKQIDKLSQWTGERLFREEKTQLSSALLELEEEMDTRTRGSELLANASQTYVKHLSTRSKLDDAELAGANGKEKVLPMETLGIVMAHYGEGLGRSSEYGSALAHVGRAQSKVAAAQEAFLATLSSTYLEGLERNLAVLKDYQAARKKLDSRRLTMDAAVKRQASSKKKEDRGLEEEVRIARARFEEIQEDVELRVEDVHSSEAEGIQDLGSFLDAHLDFINQYRDILLDTKRNFPASSTAARPRALSQTRPSYRVSTYENSDPSPESSRPTSSFGNRTRSDSTKSDKAAANRARSNSARSEKGGGGGGIFSSLRRKGKWDALDDDAPDGGGHDSYAEEDEDEKLARRNARDSPRPPAAPSPRGAPLPGMGVRTRSAGATSTLSALSGAGPARTLPPPAGGMVRRNTTPLSPVDPDERVVKALYDFNGSASDELSLKVGDLVVVTSEVSDDWYQGKNESTGERGIFPSAYTEAYQRPTPVTLAPPLPSSLRPSTAASSAPVSRTASSYGLQPSSQHMRPLSNASSPSFDEQDLNSPYNDFSSDDGLPSDDGEEDDKAGLTTTQAFRAPPSQTHSRFASTSSISGKKGPAPPPPASRRLTVSSSSNALGAAGAGERGVYGRPSSKSVGAGEDSERNPFFG